MTHAYGAAPPAPRRMQWRPLTQRKCGLRPRLFRRGRTHQASQVARWVVVTSAAKAAVWRIGMVRRAYWTFACPTQDLMSAWALFVSARAATAAHVRANLPFMVPR